MSERTAGRTVEEFALGSHRVRFEEPDLCILVLDGELLVAQVDELFGRLRRFLPGKPYFYMMVLLITLGVSPAARRAIAENSKTIGPHMTLIIGAKFYERVFSLLVERVVRFMTPQFDGVRFFDSEAEARDWVVQQRLQRLGG